MKGFILLFVGVILLIVGIIIYAVISNDPMSTTVEGVQITNGIRNLLRFGIGGLIGGLGGILILFGLISVVRGSKQKKQNLHIMKTGIDAVGTITFIDKNYSLQVNNKPIYSIVEYIYQDSSGNEHTRRVDTINSDLVIRNQFEVGAKVSVKYAADDSSKSVIILQPASKAKQASHVVRCQHCGSSYTLKEDRECSNCGASYEEL